LTGLSHRGEVVNLKSWGAGSKMKIEEYIDAHYVANDSKGRESTPYPGNKQSQPEDYCTCIDQDHRFSLVSLGIEATHVICSAMYETHSI
jgi:hypothetical protein